MQQLNQDDAGILCIQACNARISTSPRRYWTRRDSSFRRITLRFQGSYLSPAGYAVWTGVIRPVLMAGEAGSISLPQLQNADAGFAPTRGSLSSDGGYVDVTGSGVGTQGLLLDGFRYGYRQLTGNGQITVRLTNQEAVTGANPLAGVMVRRVPDSGIPLRVRVFHARHGCWIHVSRRGQHCPGRRHDATDHGSAPLAGCASCASRTSGRATCPADGKTWQQCGTFTFI